MSVKDQNGKVVYTRTKEYAIYDLHFENQPDGFMGLNEWDITKMTRFNEGIGPGEIDSKTFIIPLPEGTKSVDIEASFRFLYEEDEAAIWKSVTKKIEF